MDDLDLFPFHFSVAMSVTWKMFSLSSMVVFPQLFLTESRTLRLMEYLVSQLVNQANFCEQLYPACS